MTTTLFKKIRYRIAGDCGLLVEFGQGIDPQVNARVRSMAGALEKTRPDGILEIIPTYCSMLLIYDPTLTCPDKICPRIDTLDTTLDTEDQSLFKVVEIPVCYGSEFGPDIETVQKSHDLSSQEVIDIHCKPDYLIYMVGFTPGFAFLGGLDKRLHTPRLETPRMKVPKGAVGIANNQTGMYPVQSPGGWQIIGRTPLNLFNPNQDNPFLYRAGDKIRFIPISEQKFYAIAEKEAQNEGI